VSGFKPSTWEAKQWLIMRINGVLRLVENYPARGTATRNHKRGKEPFSNLESRRGVSIGAGCLVRARKGDDDAFDDLAAIVAQNIANIAAMNQWLVDGDRALGVARALVAREIGKIDTENDMAIIAGISRQAWHKTWRGRVDDLHRQCIMPLVAELK
jgi:hypothetical protein